MTQDTEVPRIHNPGFLDLLIREGLLSEQDSINLLGKFNGNVLALLVHLVRAGISSKENLCRLWGDSAGHTYVDLEKTLFQREAVLKLPRDLAGKLRMIPLYQMGGAVTVAMVDPSRQDAVKEAEMIMGCAASPVFSLPAEIEDAIEIQYQTQGAVVELMNRIASNALFKGTSKITREQMHRLAGDQSVVDFTRGMLLMGIKERASDIHIEPGEFMARVRLRIDGVLHERLKLDLDIVPMIVSRLKVLAKADITERRRPLDGHITLDLPNKTIDFRFSSMPTIYGEKVVLRILGSIQTRNIPEISELYFSQDIHQRLKRLLETPNGVFFVTGPTGSGKTTTLYSALQHLNREGINIMTIEDPVEYKLNGISQVQVNHEIDLDFASALRSFLRQDPDVILVGEVRDAETAKISAQAALTGHLVFTTMHTNNALQAVTRLIEIGVEPFLVAPSIIGVMAQRLVRRLCDHCKERYELSPSEMEDLFIWDSKTPVSFFRAKGCEQCSDTGYLGRIAIHELLIINTGIRRMIADNASILDIKETAVGSGFENMRYDGMKKVLRGLTTLEEIDRATIAAEEE